MLEDMPKPLMALIFVFILIAIAIFFIMSGIDPFKAILTPSLPQEIIKIGGSS